MLGEVAVRYPALIDTFEEAGAVLGLDLWQLVCRGPAETLARTELTQPLVLTGSVALWRVWCSMSDLRPALLAGHSLGEYSALVAAGSLQFPDAVRITAARGRLMQAAVPEGQGAMAAILGLADETVEAICREVAEQQVVAAANYNSPGQVVIAGESAAVERAIRACQDAGARRAVKLPVSVPSHCRLMAPAAESLRAELEDVAIEPPRIPLIHNADLERHQSIDQIRMSLVAQLCSPVRWTAVVRQMSLSGVSIVAECGPGRVLTALGRRIEREQEWLALDAPDGMDTLQEALRREMNHHHD